MWPAAVGFKPHIIYVTAARAVGNITGARSNVPHALKHAAEGGCGRALARK